MSVDAVDSLLLPKPPARSLTFFTASPARSVNVFSLPFPGACPMPPSPGSFRVVNVASLAPGILRVRFNREPADNSQLRVPSNYVVTPRTGFAVPVQVRTVEHTPGTDYVDLYLYRWITKNGDYTLRVDSVSDLDGVEVSS